MGATLELSKVNQLLGELYADQYTAEQIAGCARRFADLVARFRAARAERLKTRDRENPQWFTSHELVAYSLYAERFAPAGGAVSPLARLTDELDYFSDLGVNVIHLLPFLQSSGDGGFAVDDFTRVDSRLGTVEEFQRLVQACHARGIYVAGDLVLNHVSNRHAWAVEAMRGNPAFQRYFVWDRTDTGRRWEGVSDVFPEFAPGHWDYVPEVGRWVWATFYKRCLGPGQEVGDVAQWDLNYREPEVLLGMLSNLLELANWGIDVFRLDAVPYIWKQPGTKCKNLPQVHTLLKLFRWGLQSVAPRAVFLAEANLPAVQLQQYFDDEVQLAYNFPVLPALWQAVVLGRVATLENAVCSSGVPAESQTPSSQGQLWLFSECHDELTLGSLDWESLKTLSDVFWRRGGVPFRCARRQDCLEQRGECRPDVAYCFSDRNRYPKAVSGTSFSLLGGGSAGSPDPCQAEAQLRLLWQLKLSLSGTPLFYMGEELGVEIHPEYADHRQWPADSRWVKRVDLTDSLKARRHDRAEKEGRLYQGLRHLLRWRQAPGHEFLSLPPTFFDTGSDVVLGFQKSDPANPGTVCILANCSAAPQLVAFDLDAAWSTPQDVGPDPDPTRPLAWTIAVVDGKHRWSVELPPFGFLAWRFPPLLDRDGPAEGG